MYCADVLDRINYNHLHYFWVVAKEGSIAAASARLHVTQPTISGQLRELEGALGQKLFARAGRGLMLSEAGRVAFRYADDIFTIGADLLDALRGAPGSGDLLVRVGVADVLPKLVVFRMLAPLLRMAQRPRFLCCEGKPTDLINRLVVHELDVVLTDTPVPPYAGLRVFSHRLGESELGVFGSAALSASFRRDFPASLNGAPFLLPTPGTAVRRALDYWFDRHEIRPRVIGEFEDSALLKIFGQSGAGLFAAPTFIEREIRSQYGVRLLGSLPHAREEFYAISIERRIRHPAVSELTDTMRQRLDRGKVPRRPKQD